MLLGIVILIVFYRVSKKLTFVRNLCSPAKGCEYVIAGRLM